MYLRRNEKLTGKLTFSKISAFNMLKSVKSTFSKSIFTQTFLQFSTFIYRRYPLCPISNKNVRFPVDVFSFTISQRSVTERAWPKLNSNVCFFIRLNPQLFLHYHIFKQIFPFFYQSDFFLFFGLAFLSHIVQWHFRVKSLACSFLQKRYLSNNLMHKCLCPHTRFPAN